MNKDRLNYIHQLSIDCVIFGYQKRALKVLIPQLKFAGDFWTLPGGFIFQDESINTAAHRILAERTGLEGVFLEQFHVFGDVPRQNTHLINQLTQSNEDLTECGLESWFLDWLNRRFISIGYYALVDINKVIPKILHLDKAIEWYDVYHLPPLIMDHEKQIRKALEVLRSNLDEKLLGFSLLPEMFTIREIQQVYETIYDKPFHRGNFQKKMLDLGVLERLEKKFTGASNKAPYLYRFKPHSEPRLTETLNPFQTES